MKALIVDHEYTSRNRLRNYLESYCKNAKIFEASNLKTGLCTIRNTKPDILFLEIELKDENSFTLLDCIRDFNITIIITTKNDKYALKAFEYAVLHYLIKPISFASFNKAIDRYSSLQKTIEVEVKKYLYVKTTSNAYNIDLDNITFIKANGNYSIIHKKDGTTLCTSKKIGDYKVQLATHFYRSHNSIIVNLDFVQNINNKNNQAILSNGTLIPISRRKIKGFVEAFKYNFE